MALKQADKDKLKAMGITDVDALVNAIKADTEVDYTVPEGRIYTDAQITERDTNNGSTQRKEGEKEARGILVTEIGKQIPGLTLKGERIGDLVKEITTFMSAGATDQVKQLTTQNQALIADKAKLEADVTTERTRAEGVLFDASLMDLFPANATPDLTARERLTLIKSGMVFEKGTDGAVTVKKDGVQVTDPQTRAPIPAKQVIAGYFTDRKWVGEPGAGNSGGGGNGGRGGGGSDPGGGGSAGIKTLTQAKLAWKKENPNGNPVSPDFQKYVKGIAEKDATFDYNG